MDAAISETTVPPVIPQQEDTWHLHGSTADAPERLAPLHPPGGVSFIQEGAFAGQNGPPGTSPVRHPPFPEWGNQGSEKRKGGPQLRPRATLSLDEAEYVPTGRARAPSWTPQLSLAADQLSAPWTQL